MNYFYALRGWQGETVTIATPGVAYTGKIVSVYEGYLLFDAEKKAWNNEPIHSEVLILFSAICGVERPKKKTA